MGAAHLAEREAGGVVLADGGADARGARAASGEAHASLASESDAAGAEEGDGDGRGSCAAARARRPSMAALPCRGRGGRDSFCWELDALYLSPRAAAVLLLPED